MAMHVMHSYWSITYSNHKNLTDKKGITFQKIIPLPPFSLLQRTKPNLNAFYNAKFMVWRLHRISLYEDCMHSGSNCWIIWEIYTPLIEWMTWNLSIFFSYNLDTVTRHENPFVTSLRIISYITNDKLL